MGKYLDIAEQLEEKPPVAEPAAIQSEDDPVLRSDQWYPEFQAFHHAVVRETPEFDYIALRDDNPDLYGKIKEIEIRIDALGEIRLSEVMALLRDWREMILRADFEQRNPRR